MYNLSDIWTEVLEIIRPEIPEVSFNTWLENIVPVSFDGSVLTIEVPLAINRDMVSKRFSEHIKNAFLYMSYNVEEIKILIASERKNDGARLSVNTYTPSFAVDEESNYLLNKDYTFDTFVVGPSNEFAHAACYCVAEKSISLHNPLFLYGGTGLGKTHLMHAIGNLVLENSPDKKVLYVSSEKFTNDLINAIRDEKTEQFRQKYRTIDILMVDDVQFFCGKETTQEEFFHTFNTLFQAGKQIVLSSDRPPKDLQGLEDRLINRFASGLAASIQLPELETRIAILKKKAMMYDIDVSNEVCQYIATNITSNIREMEGAMKKLVSYHQLMNKEITLELVEESIKDFKLEKKKNITPELILDTVAKHYNLKIADLRSDRRTNDIAYPRQVAMYILKELTDLSQTAIGKILGDKHYTTVIHGIRKIEGDLISNSKTHAAVNSILDDLEK
ncbi:MAG: chromosomal replication initiator protein DnaA [Clostridia bacterium]|nr:chromosomal replication initiator protein DnaA [Clostridia bacterium]